MFSRKPSHKRWTNWKVGLSCFFYLAPAVVIWYIWFIAMNIRYSAIYEFTLYIIVASNSFIADYIFMGHTSIWHAIDRWSATTCFFVNLAKPIILSFTIMDWIMAIIATYVALFLLNQSRAAKSPSNFRTYHIGWHVFGGLWMAYLIYLEHTLVNNINHPFIDFVQYIFPFSLSSGK